MIRRCTEARRQVKTIHPVIFLKDYTTMHRGEQPLSTGDKQRIKKENSWLTTNNDAVLSTINVYPAVVCEGEK